MKHEIVSFFVTYYIPVFLPVTAGVGAGWLLFKLPCDYFKKGGKSRRLIVSLALGSMCVLVSHVFLRDLQLNVPSTTYARGYSLQGFKAVQVGDTRRRVHSLLGEPLFERENPGDRFSEHLYYSKPAVGYARDYWQVRIVVDTQEDKVTKKEGRFAWYF